MNNLIKIAKKLKNFSKGNLSEYKNFILCFENNVLAGNGKRLIKIEQEEEIEGVKIYTLDKPKKSYEPNEHGGFSVVKKDNFFEITDKLEHYEKGFMNFKFKTPEEIDFPFIEFDVEEFNKKIQIIKKIYNNCEINLEINDTFLTFEQWETIIEEEKQKLVGKFTFFQGAWCSEKPISMSLEIDINDFQEIFKIAKFYKEKTIKFYYEKEENFFYVIAENFKAVFTVECLEAPEVFDFDTEVEDLDEPEIFDTEVELIEEIALEVPF